MLFMQWKRFLSAMLTCLMMVWTVPTLADSSAMRIVSLGGSLTETIVALGLADALVGVDRSSVRPPEVVNKLPRTGTLHSIPLEAVLSMSPTVVVAYDDLQPPEVLPSLRSLGIQVVSVSHRSDIATARQKILDISSGLGVAERGKALLAKIDKDLAWPDGKPQPQHKARVLFIQSMGSGPLRISGTETKAAALLAAAGVDNAVTAFSGYRPLNTEAMLSINPDVIVILKRTLERIGGLSGLKALPGMRDIQAIQNNRIVVSDDSAFLGMGPGFGAAVRQLREAVYGP